VVFRAAVFKLLVCRMLQHPANRTHNPQLHTRPAMQICILIEHYHVSCSKIILQCWFQQLHNNLIQQYTIVQQAPYMFGLPLLGDIKEQRRQGDKFLKTKVTFYGRCLFAIKLQILWHTWMQIVICFFSRVLDLYLTTHDTHNRQTFMPPAGFQPAVRKPSGRRPTPWITPPLGLCKFIKEISKPGSEN